MKYSRIPGLFVKILIVSISINNFLFNNNIGINKNACENKQKDHNLATK